MPSALRNALSGSVEVGKVATAETARRMSLSLPPSATKTLEHLCLLSPSPPETRREKWRQSHRPDLLTSGSFGHALSLVSPNPVCCRTAMGNLGTVWSVWGVVPDGAFFRWRARLNVEQGGVAIMQKG